MSEEKKGLGLLALVGMVVSSCIGSGVFATAGQYANAASPGGFILWARAADGSLTMAYGKEAQREDQGYRGRGLSE